MAAVILALRQYPQGGAYNKTTPTDRIPSPLMGEESKVRVKKMPQHRPVIADLVRNPEGQGVTWGNNKTNQPTESPLP